MKFKIHNGIYEENIVEDSIIIEADTIEGIRSIAQKELEKRPGWKHCWSEKIEGGE